MKEIVKPAVVLLLITAIAAACLGAVSEITKPYIADQVKRTQDAAMKKVMPDAEEFEEIEMEPENSVVAVNKAIKGGEVVGYVVNVQPGGFGGAIDTMVGVDAQGVITGLTVLGHAETPGLGAKATDASFSDQFVGKQSPVMVTKDGGEIVSITSATITSRAVANGATAACDWVLNNGGAK